MPENPIQIIGIGIMKMQKGKFLHTAIDVAKNLKMNNDNYELPPVGVKSPPDLDDPVAAWIKNDKYPDGHLVYLPPSVLKKIKIVRRP